MCNVYFVDWGAQRALSTRTAQIENDPVDILQTAATTAVAFIADFLKLQMKF